MTRLLIANFLHRLAHAITPRQWPCDCAVLAYQHGWKQRRDAELREAALPSTPDDLDAWFRRVIADSERGVA